MTAEQRVSAIRACGVEKVTILDFTAALARLSPDDFAARYLASASVRCGADWRFGREGAGDAAWLRAHGTAVEVVPSVAYAGAAISSSRIRAALERGEVEDARAMLGRPFEVRGSVFCGKGLGAKLGYPTLNLRPEGMLLRLPRGVYAVEVGGEPAVANYGVSPTAGDRAWEEAVLEVHFLRSVPPRTDGGSGLVRVGFLRYVRPERTFASWEELRRQIAADVDFVRRDLGRL